MSGVMFIICIPRERYETCMDNSIRMNRDDLKKQQQHQSQHTVSSSSSSEISRPDLSNFPIAAATAATSLSYENEISNLNGKRDGEEEEPFVQGSMDSEVFQRAVQQRRELREKDEVIEKFFNTPTKADRILDKMLTPMEKIMREIIRKMDIKNVSWKMINNSNFYKISFCMEKGTRCDEIIHLLSEYGVGQRKGSTIAVIPCTYYDNRGAKDNHTRQSSESLKETTWNKFVGTMRARLNVAKIVDAVKSDASLTFDFVVLLIVAAVLASFGLVENGTLFLAASMLISPLMGPILAATFGAAIRDHKLQYLGMKNEIFGIFMCIFVGFIFGLMISGVDFMFGDTKKLTPEILSRCNMHSVLVGICIALPSGAAQSIALLRENFGSLVGVAISASLLPPAVNTGLLWSFSCLSKLFSHTGKFNNFIEEKKYEVDEATELIILGSISLLVTLTNVFSVYMMGYIFLRLKIQVAPLQNEEERLFWRHDVPIARDYNKTLNAEDGKKLCDELREFRVNDSDNFKGIGRELLRQDFYSTHTWSPVSHRYQHDLATFKELDALYKNMKIEEKENEKDQGHKSICKRKSDPIATAKASTSYECENLGSMDDVQVSRHITFVNVLSSSNEDNEQKPATRKFLVTPASDPFV